MAADQLQKKFVDVKVKQVEEDPELFSDTLRKVLNTPNEQRSTRAKALLQAFQVYYEEIFAFGCSVSDSR